MMGYQAAKEADLTNNHNPDVERWSEFLNGEMVLLQLLGRMFYPLPDRAWLQSLIDEAVFFEAPFAADQPDVSKGLELLQAWSHAGLDDESFKAVQIDYTRLFAGFGTMTVPPWESVYFSEERLTFQEETIEVRRWYGRFGLEVEKLRQEPDDHIGLELTFVAHLAWRGLQCLQEEDMLGFEHAIDAQKRFLSGHLLRWASSWATLAADVAQTKLYQGLALLTRGALAELESELHIPAPTVKLT